jgi:hypothetical protein
MKTIKICTQCNKTFNKYNYYKGETCFCCRTCYGLWQKGKSFLSQNKKTRPKKSCLINNCIKIHFGKGYCKSHYWQFVEKPKRIHKPIIKIEKEKSHCRQCGTLFSSHKNAIFCSRFCFSENKIKPFIIKKGYKKILDYLHPRADAKGYVFEHIIIMEKHIQRSLIKGEVIHHIDGNKKNNDITNLMLFPDNKSHLKFHYEIKNI